MRISDWSSDVCSSDLRNPVCSAFVREIGYQRKKALGMAASDDRMPPGHQFVIFKQCDGRSEEHTSELQSLMRISYAVFCLKKKKTKVNKTRQMYPTYISDIHESIVSSVQHYIP